VVLVYHAHRLTFCSFADSNLTIVEVLCAFTYLLRQAASQKRTFIILFESVALSVVTSTKACLLLTLTILAQEANMSGLLLEMAGTDYQREHALIERV